MSPEPLDIKDLPERQRMAFYAALFAMANADGETTREELNLVFETLDLDGLSTSRAETVRGYAVSPPALEPSLRSLQNVDERVRFGLALNLIDIAVVDDDITEEENEALAEAFEILGVNEQQMIEMVSFSAEMKRIRERGLDDNIAAKALKNATAGLAGVGVPIGAIYMCGSVLGLGAAGITSGLAALGAFIGLAGMVPGIGVAIAIGGGVIWGVRKLTDADGRRAKEGYQRERERKAQLVIKNLQDTIVHIIERMTTLETKANESAANRKALDDLRTRLSSLQKILRQRKATAAHG